MSSPMRCTASWSLTERSSSSFPSLSQAVKERTILVSGASKTYAMTGWRIGFAAAGREIVQVMSNYLSHSLSGHLLHRPSRCGGGLWGLPGGD